MKQYGDLDKLSEQITTNHCGACGIYNGEMCCSCPMNDALRYIDETPTADVAPRAEIAREIFEEIEKVLEREYTDIDQRREYITDHDALDGIDGKLCGLDYAISLVTALKKKYTGGDDHMEKEKT